MRVTLIRPPAYSQGIMGAQLVPFLGVAYIAAAARKVGHSVDIVDMCGEDITRTEIVQNKFVAHGMPFATLEKRISDSQVIGFTSTFSQDWVFHKKLIKYVRKICPDSIFVAGGEHISALPGYCLDDCPELDICVVGEGEGVFVKLLEVLEKKGELSAIPSLVYRMPNNNTHCYAPRANRIKDIDSISQPAWDLTPMENYLSRELNYHIKRGRTIPMLATRGCPHRCSFCSNSNMWGNPWISRNPSSVVDEIEGYIKRYKANNFVFSDLTAVMNKEDIIKLCTEILNRKIDITWQLPTLRTEAIDRGILQLMHKVGCRELDFAIESGSINVLKSVNKKNDPKKIISLIRDALDIGMNLSVNIVIGLPEEGFKDFFKTYILTARLALMGLHELNVFPFIPYPGSELFYKFLKSGKIKLNDEYFFDLFAYADLSKAVSWSDRFSPRTLSLMRLFLLINFYGLMFISHPRRLLKLGVNVIRGVPTTKLEGVLGRVFKTIKIYFTHGEK